MIILVIIYAYFDAYLLLQIIKFELPERIDPYIFIPIH